MSGIVTKYIERFLCVLTSDAAIKVIQLDEVTAIDGVPVKSDQIGAESVKDAKVLALLDKISATTHAELVAAQSAIESLTSDRDTLQTQADTIPGLQSHLKALAAAKAELEAEVARLTALVPPPVPDAFLSAEWPRFRDAILVDEAVQRVAAGNPAIWPVLAMYMQELQSNPLRGADIGRLWTLIEANTPVTPDEVARINAIAADCGVPLRMNENGSIG